MPVSRGGMGGGMPVSRGGMGGGMPVSRGGMGGGFRAAPGPPPKLGSGLLLWKKDYELGVGGEARTRFDILRVVLGPFVQYCPFELKRKRACYCHHSICINKRAI